MDSNKAPAFAISQQTVVEIHSNPRNDVLAEPNQNKMIQSPNTIRERALCRRRHSYPCAMRSSKKQLKQILQRAGQESQQIYESEEVKNTLFIVKLLRRHLTYIEAVKTDALLDTKTGGQMLNTLTKPLRKRDVINFLLARPDCLPTPAGAHSLEQCTWDELLQRLLSLSRSNTLPETVNIPLEHLNTSLWNDKAALKNIYNDLKKQHLHRILSKHATTSNLAHSMSMQSLVQFDSSHNSTGSNGTSSSTRKHQQDRQILPAKQFHSCNIETNFIHSRAIRRLAQKYEKGGAGANAGTDNDGEKQTTSQAHSLLSSIDGEDVSQSLSDAVSQYLRIARQKKHTNLASRFKRVNSSLRNMQVKGKINPPVLYAENINAMGDVQPCDLEISHIKWQRALGNRLRRKAQYKPRLTGGINKFPYRGSAVTTSRVLSSNLTANVANIKSSTSTYDTRPRKEQIKVKGNTSRVTANAIRGNSSHTRGIFDKGSRFIANLWHCNTSSNLSSTISLMTATSNEPNMLASLNDATDGIDMKKYKMQSRLGHYVSTLLLRSHSKHQVNPFNTSGVPKWSRLGKCFWKSETGEHIFVQDTAFHLLSELEANVVKKICIERIIELDVGINITELIEAKSHKPTMRGLITRFFHTRKQNTDKPTNEELSLFDASLEECVAREMLKISAFTSRGSNDSIVSSFQPGSPEELRKNVRSCENFFTNAESQLEFADASNNIDLAFVENLPKYRSIYCSQSNARPYSLDNFMDVQIFKELKAPKFFKCCVHFLEENGMHKANLFRISASKNNVKQLQRRFDENVNTSIDKNTCPHTVATLLKKFLRDLPEPLLTNRLYKVFLKSQKIHNRPLQLEIISYLVKLLPPVNLDTLYVLLKLLAKVAAWSEDLRDNTGKLHFFGNKMDSKSLATVFAPIILGSTVNKKPPARNITKHLTNYDAVNVTRLMTDHYKELFLVPADIMDVVFSRQLATDRKQLYAICEYHKAKMHSFIQFY